jgi:hypothetical protein
MSFDGGAERPEIERTGQADVPNPRRQAKSQTQLIG